MEQYVKWMPGWENEYWGFNQGTLGLLLVLVLLGFIIRLLTMELVTHVFRKSEHSIDLDYHRVARFTAAGAL